MANHRADGRASRRKPGLTGGNHRGAPLPAQVVKVGVVGALATATIAAPLAAAAAGVDTDVQAGAAPVNLASSAQAQTVLASTTAAVAAPVALPVASSTAVETRADDDSSRSEDRESVESQEVATTTEGIEIEAPDPKVYDENGAVLEESDEGYIYPVNARISSGYGWRTHPVLGYAKLHDGVDFAASCGEEVHASAAGTVVAVEYNSSSGNRVKIDHGDGVITGYYHLSGFNTSVGATVEQGDVIGYVGSTGRSTGCHLHFAKMDASGEYSNPMTLLQ